uniref:Uncharacterized protein n=1 Tax=Magallana gigas TaxID=29159 RepID=A0A8W8M3Y7_MAGGI
MFICLIKLGPNVVSGSPSPWLYLSATVSRHAISTYIVCLLTGWHLLLIYMPVIETWDTTKT